VLSASVEIELKLDWQGLKKVKHLQILHLIDRLDEHDVNRVLSPYLTPF